MILEPTSPLKICNKCKQPQPLSHFYRNTRAKDGHMSRCKKCEKAHDQTPERKEQNSRKKRKWEKANPDKVAHYARKQNYGLTPEQFEEMKREQSNRCAICGVADPLRMAVDHDHETGRVRALLCPRCNSALGNFRDDTEILAKAIAYLKRFK